MQRPRRLKTNGMLIDLRMRWAAISYDVFVVRLELVAGCSASSPRPLFTARFLVSWIWPPNRRPACPIASGSLFSIGGAVLLLVYGAFTPRPGLHPRPEAFLSFVYGAQSPISSYVIRRRQLFCPPRRVVPEAFS